MDYAQCLCFLGEIYRDMGQTEDAIDALDRGIRLHEKTSSYGLEASQVNIGSDQMALERT